MKKIKLYTAILMAAALTATSCSDFTDIKPKGKNLLSSTDELELLFNNDIDISLSDVYNIGGSVISGANQIPAELLIRIVPRISSASVSLPLATATTAVATSG